MANKLLKEALQTSMEKEFDSIPWGNDAIEHSFSHEFEGKMKPLIKKSKIKYVNLNKFKIRRSIVAATLTIIIAAASMSVEAVRFPVIKLTEKIYSEFSEILFSNEDNIDVPETIEDFYVPAYIPEGYTLIDEQNLKLMYFLVYSNEKDEHIHVGQNTLSVSMAVDTEGITTEEITIKDMNGIIYSKRGLTTVIVNDNSYVYTVSGYESREEIIKIVESLYIKE